MAKLIYSAITSADGYVEDATGRFDWAAPGEELLCFVNDLERLVGATAKQSLPLKGDTWKRRQPGLA